MRRPGPYAPLAAFYADDEKIMEAGEDAELLYVRMLAYAARTPGTEGWISESVLMSRLGILPRESGNGAGTVPGTDAGSRAGVLLRVGLIERDGSGYRIKSWLKWNRSSQDMDRERERDRRRKTSGNDGNDAGNGAGNGAGTDAGFRGDRSDTDTDTTTRGRKRPRESHEGRFDEFWQAYPRKVGRGAAEKAWIKAVKATDADIILDGLATQRPELAARQKDFIPHPTTWLNSRRWEDEASDSGQDGGGGDPWANIPRVGELRFHDDEDGPS